MPNELKNGWNQNRKEEEGMQYAIAPGYPGLIFHSLNEVELRISSNFQTDPFSELSSSIGNGE